MGPGSNWSGNVLYRAQRVAEPTSIAELQDLVKSEERVRVVGSRHCFNDIADTDGVQVSLGLVETAAPLRIGEGTFRVPAWLRYGDLIPALRAENVSLANLASLPHISVAGAVQTGTHGSGDAVGSLATQVSALEFVSGEGELVRLERGGEDFDGAVVGLGALGVLTHVELDVSPAREIAQSVFEGVRLDAVLADLGAVTGAGESVSMFTTWQEPETITQVWVKSAGAPGAGAIVAAGGRPAEAPRHPILGIDPEPCTPQMGVFGPWYDRLPHFRLEFTPSVGAELQSEYLVPREDAVAAIEAVAGLASRIAPLLFVCEIRTMAADPLWLSPAFGTDTVGLHFTWKPDEAAVRALLPDLEATLPGTARPHWGKVFTMPGGDVSARYPRWADFAELRGRMDPARRFANDYLARLGL
ncbi:D-arabinono-1,4-lactone oxidase [Tessaracoccus sp. Z1128]